MRCFEQAEKIRPPGNDDAMLRWNRCVRLLESHPPSAWHREAQEFEVEDSNSF